VTVLITAGSKLRRKQWAKSVGLDQREERKIERERSRDFGFIRDRKRLLLRVIV
jgi:hypothetical protein